MGSETASNILPVWASKKSQLAHSPAGDRESNGLGDIGQAPIDL
jgi:hypothetical protein